jgi:hypothetical protein
MTFGQLYGEALNVELASSDTTQLFTTVRRKAAINEAMQAFVRETGCTKRNGTLTVVDGDGEYDLETEFTDFLRLAGDPGLKVVNGSSTRWIQGKTAFPQTDVDTLDWTHPGWRDLDPGQPECWYLDEADGDKLFGIVPPPDFASGDTWTARIPYVAKPTALSADADIPFTVGSDYHLSLEPFHQGLAHYGAARLEALRKNYDGFDRQMKLYAGYVGLYRKERLAGGTGTIQLARDYYGEQHSDRWSEDPRR